MNRVLGPMKKLSLQLKNVLIFIGLVVSIQSFAAELEISFPTINLDHQDAHLKVTLESTNPLCSKLVVGIGGIAIGPRYDFFNGKIESEGNLLTATAQYDEGGFCQYQISEFYLYFLHNKNAYFETKVTILSKQEWSGGALDLTELSTNQNANLTVTCEGKKTVALSSCVAANNGKPNGRGNIGKLYIWREHLRETDRYQGATLRFIGE